MEMRRKAIKMKQKHKGLKGVNFLLGLGLIPLLIMFPHMPKALWILGVVTAGMNMFIGIIDRSLGNDRICKNAQTLYKI